MSCNGNVNLLQIFVTSDKDDEEMKKLNNDIKRILKSTTRHDVTILFGDFNVKVEKV